MIHPVSFWKNTISLVLFISNIFPASADQAKAKTPENQIAAQKLSPTIEISTNETHFVNAPAWLNRLRVDAIVQKVEKTMEWDTRKVQVQWYTDQAAFQKFHGYNASVLAVSKKEDNSIHIGPRVTDKNFDGVFGHELVHIIVFQKYKDAIPAWLNEGLANYVAHQGKVDYAWLNTQPTIDVRLLVHPFQKPLQQLPSESAGETPSGKRGHSKKGEPTHENNKTPIISSIDPIYHYQASTALIEMIAARCSLDDLLQLSVGKKLETYLSTFCEISDINESFKAWLKKQKPTSTSSS